MKKADKLAEETLNELEEKSIEISGEKLPIPKKVMKLFIKDKIEEVDKGENIEFWKESENDFEKCFTQWLIDNFEVYQYEGIVDEELAKFVIAYQIRNRDFGGSPIEEYMTFKDNGFEYTICSFGRVDGTDNFINLIGYKKKI